METTWGDKWLWYNLEADMVSHGLEDFQVLKVERDHVLAKTMGMRLRVDWVKDKYCVLTMERYLPSVVDVFEEVLEIPPLGIYEKHGWTVVEFEKEDVHKRAKELGEERDRGLIKKIR